LVQRQLEDHAKQQGTDVETQKQRFLTEKQAMAEFSTPEQIGALAVFLCSEGARTITGAPISIDGGWVAQ
jgi:3-hydroxybutyrate dehydrogenase